MRKDLDQPVHGYVERNCCFPDLPVETFTVYPRRFIEQVSIASDMFQINTGKDATHLVLGRTEMAQLSGICSIIDPKVLPGTVTHFFGLTILESFDDYCLLTARVPEP